VTLEPSKIALQLLKKTKALKVCLVLLQVAQPLGIELTKRALIFGIEHSSYEREIISQLLSAAYDIFEGREILDGFQLLLYRLPDLVLDVPNAPQILAKVNLLETSCLLAVHFSSYLRRDPSTGICEGCHC
jgi:hypothetical protein